MVDELASANLITNLKCKIRNQPILFRYSIHKKLNKSRSVSSILCDVSI